MASGATPWFRRMRASFEQAARSPAGQEIALTALHAIESRTVLDKDAEITAKLLQNVGPLLTALQPTPDAIVRAGALLVVKDDGVVTVRQLTAAQQLLLDRSPHLAKSPRRVLEALALAPSNEHTPAEEGCVLDLTGDPAACFPDVNEPLMYTSARIRHCAYKTMVPLVAFANLRRLDIIIYPDDTLEPLGRLKELEELSILSLPRVTSLAPLVSLTRLRKLELAMIPNGVADVTEVDSLAPLCALPNLQEVHLLGVRSSDHRVDDLIGCPTLRIATASHYPQSEIARLRTALAARHRPAGD